MEKSRTDTLNEIIAYAKDVLETNKEYLYGEEERSDDLYLCGCVDGEYDALINILDLAGVEHNYQKQT
ncbi:MAG: hypothetical protein J1E41_01660 [Ruminococcus sp.]|nr:hypothetical protein [Ruminococcus sp.]